MSEILGKTKYLELMAAMNSWEELETELSEHPDDIIGVYKSDWYLDECGEILATYLIEANLNPYRRYATELAVNEFFDKISSMQKLDL